MRAFFSKVGSGVLLVGSLIGLVALAPAEILKFLGLVLIIVLALMIGAFVSDPGSSYYDDM